MRVTINIAANLTAQLWSTLLQLLLVPVYIRLLGMEAYGMIGVFLMLSASLQVFDLGFAQTLNRELARWTGQAKDVPALRDLVWTIEVIYYTLIVVIAGVLIVMLPAVGRDALHAGVLDRQTVATAVALMVAVVTLQWPINLYQGGLMGLQQQVTANALRVASTTIAGVGAVLCLYYVSASIVTFFAWQIVSAAVALAASSLVFRSRLPRSARRARFAPAILKPVWRFSAGVSALTISAIVLTQMDKWLLASLLPLATFGAYALAWTAANGLSLLTAPVFAAIYPRFSSLVARDERHALIGLYHVATQAIAASIVPAALVMSCFATEVVWAWTGDRAVAEQAAPVLAVLAIGTLLNSFAHMPYAWELAHGRTRVFLALNWVAVAVSFPLLWYLATRWGGVGAAFVWVLLNVSYFVVAIPVIHRNLPAGESRQWLLRDVIAPVLLAGCAIWAYRVLMPPAQGRAQALGQLAAGFAICALAALFGTRDLREMLRRLVPVRKSPVRR
jgi:O-antigen/teichoic acid export membrane protein